jgi:VCBS repeat-containing protein
MSWGDWLRLRRRSPAEARAPKRVFRRRTVLERLEPRILLSADGLVPIDADLAAAQTDPFAPDPAPPAGEVDSDALTATLLLDTEASTALVIEGLAITGTNAGQVYEDGARPAVGQLNALNAGGAPVWLVETPSSPLGSLSIDATGRWTYVLKNEVTAVQDLAHGEIVTDSFTVRLSDGLTSVAEVVSVSVVGTNDFPFIPAAPLPQTVIEGLVATASGQIAAFDRDHAAQLDWSLSASLTGYSSDYRVEAERLVVIRNGVTIVDDSFSDGLIPTTSSSNHPGFALSGSFSEQDGALVMDGARAAAATGVGDPELGAVHVAALMTNIDPANASAGLKRSHDFTIEATFDLTMPGPGQVYGLQLSDRFSGPGVNPALTQLGDDSPGLDVFIDAQGTLGVRFVDRNFVTDVLSVLGTQAILGQHDQIVLRLTHDEAAAGVVRASFDLLDGGIVTQRVDFMETGFVFGADTAHTGDDEAWTRAQISAGGRDPAPTSLRGVYGTMSIDAAGSWTYTLDNDDPDTKALGAGDTRVEAFTARVTDQYGLSQRTQLNVTVVGATEVLTITGDAAVVVHEDGAATATGFLSASNAAQGPLLWTVTAADASYGGLNLDAVTGQWTYQLNNASALTQALAQDEQALDTFTVQVTDSSGATDTQELRITIAGTNDVPGAGSLGGLPVGTLTEDGQQTASGQLIGIDPDHGATFSWSVSQAPLGYSSDYFFTADQLSIIRNGTLIFSDGFDGGGPPPSSPGFTSGAALSYGTSGLFSEAGGRLVLDGAVANATLGIGTSVLRVQNNAVLNTDQSPNLDLGLKINDDLVVEGRFDLAIPDAGEAYGIAFSDRVGANLAGDDLVFLNVFNDGAGGIEVRFDEASIVTDRVAPLASLRFAAPSGPEPAQIVLRLMHDADRPGEVSAGVEVVSGGTTLLSHTFAATAHIFGTDTPGYAGDDEVHTRVQLSAFGPDLNGSTIAGAYGTLAVDAAGAWTYTLNNEASNVQALAQGASVTDVFQVRVVDQFGASSRIPVTITVNGADETAGLTVGGERVGQVYEDGSRPAVGQLTLGGGTSGAVFWTVDAPSSQYGSLGIDAAGRWTYQLANDAQVVQDLAQGETIVDSFTVRVFDGAASTTALVSISITGTDDFPGLSAPPPIQAVAEDGQGTVSGQAFGFDRDHGAQLHWSVSTSPTGYSSDYLFLADRLKVVRDGAVILDDGFDDGIVPFTSTLSHPGYAVNGAFSESGGFLVLDGALAGAATGAGTPDLFAGNLATLLTNTDPLNTVNGLKRHHDFSVELTYDLVTPAPGQGYSLGLTDRVSGAGVPLASTDLGDDVVFLTVYAGAQGGLEVRLEERNFVTDQLTVFETVQIGQHDQIVLRFTHDNAAVGVIHASFDLLDGGVPTQRVDMSEVVHVYGVDTPAAGDDEVWTRVQLGAFGPDAEAEVVRGVYGSLSIDRMSGLWTYTLDHADPDTNTLAAGQIASDLFQVRVIDEHGLSSRAPLSITVLGASDELVIGGDTAGRVYEDGSSRVSGQLTVIDAPPGVEVWNAGTPQGSYGFLSLDPMSGLWTYQLDNFSALTQALAQGEQVVDSFTVQVTDAFGATDTETVSITIDGSNDVPGLVNVGPPPPAGASVTEDGQLTASGQFVGFDIDHGATLGWSLSRAPLGYSSDYLFSADQLSITRNGALIFSDGFDDGLPPPSSPGFTSGAFLDYGISGAFSESGGRLLFNGSMANATLGIGTNALRVQNNAVLNTNVSPDLAFGLKIDDDIVLEARFDLAVPDAGEGYGITFSDRLNPNQAGDDLVFLMVHGDGAGGLRVRFDDTSIVTDTVSVLGSFDFAAPAAPAQIVLRLMHDAERPGEVRAGFAVMSEGATLLSHDFAATGHIFGSDTPAYAGDDELFTRAQISAFGPDLGSGTTSIAGTYGTLTIDAGGAWTYNLDNDAGHVQALAQGASVTDIFQVRVVDEFGASSRAPLVITVNGANDAPVLAPIADRTVVEQAAVTFVAGAADVDVPAAALTFSLLDAPEGATIDPLTGLFSWTPDERHGGAIHELTVQVDDGLAAHSRTFAITVEEDDILNAGRNAGDGMADEFRIVRNGENVEGYLGSELVFNRSLASLAVSGLTVEGSADDDRLQVDFAAGGAIPAPGIRFVGGGPGDNDALMLSGGTADSVVYEAFGAHLGSVTVDGAVIFYEGLEPITDTLAARQRTFVFGSGDDAITLSLGDGTASLTSPSSESVTFANPFEALSIEAGAGNNAVQVIATGGDDAVTITDSGGMVLVTVNGHATTLSGATSVLVEGGNGDDVIDASGVAAAPLQLSGGAGDDRLIGGALADVLRGGQGDDVLAGRGGEDLLDGGEDHDTAELQRIAPIAYWSLNELAGSGAADSAGAPQNGTLFGRNPDHDDDGPGAALAPFGAQTGVDLHGSSREYIAVAHDPVFEVAEGTVQLWFRTRDAGERQAIFAKDHDDRGAGQLAIWLEEGDLKVKLEGASGSHRIDTNHAGFGNLVQSDRWYQLSFTFGPQGMKLYLDGVLVGANAYTGGLVGNREPIVIGGSNAENRRDDAELARLKITDAFDGWIDEVAFFGKALGVAEIAQTRERGPMAVAGAADANDALIDIERLSFVDAPSPGASDAAVAGAGDASAVSPAILAESPLCSVATFCSAAGVVELGLFGGSPEARSGEVLDAAFALRQTDAEAPGEENAPIRDAAVEETNSGPGIASPKVDWHGEPGGFTAALSPYASPATPPQPNVVDFRLRRSADEET